MSLDWQPPTLETERLILRPVTAYDVLAAYAYASNPNLTRYTLFDTHRTLEESRWFVEDYARSRYVNKEPDPLAIVRKRDQDGTMIGSIGVHWVSQPHSTMEMGYAIAEAFWGQGLVVEAAGAVMRLVFTEYPVERLQARVLLGNEASERVLAKLGFTREGVLRRAAFCKERWWDMAMWSLLRGEWELGCAMKND